MKDRTKSKMVFIIDTVIITLFPFWALYDIIYSLYVEPLGKGVLIAEAILLILVSVIATVYWMLIFQWWVMRKKAPETPKPYIKEERLNIVKIGAECVFHKSEKVNQERVLYMLSMSLARQSQPHIKIEKSEDINPETIIYRGTLRVIEKPAEEKVE